MPPPSAAVTAGRARLKSGEATRGRSKAAQKSAILSNLSTGLTKASRGAREKVSQRERTMNELLGLSVQTISSNDIPGPSPLTQYLSEPSKVLFDDDDNDDDDDDDDDGASRRGSTSVDVFETQQMDGDGDSLITPVDFNAVFSSELLDEDSPLPSLTSRSNESLQSFPDVSSRRGSAASGGAAGRAASGGSRPNSRDKIRPTSKEKLRPTSRERSQRTAPVQSASSKDWTSTNGRRSRTSVPASRESFYGAKARREFFELFHDQRARTPDDNITRTRSKRPPTQIPPLAGGARPGSSESQGRPTSRQKSARSMYLKRCHEPLQLVPVSVRDVAQPIKSFEVAVDADAMVDDLIELVTQHTGLHRDRVRLKLKAKDIRSVFQKFDLDNSGTVNAEEFRIGLRSLGIKLSDTDFDDMIGALDNDRDGEIDYDELLEDMRENQKHEAHAEGRFEAVTVDASYVQEARADAGPLAGPAAPMTQEQMQRAQSPDYAGKAVIRQVAAKIESFSGVWLDPTRTVAELDLEKGRVLLDLTIEKAEPPPMLVSPIKKPAGKNAKAKKKDEQPAEKPKKKEEKGGKKGKATGKKKGKAAGGQPAKPKMTAERKVEIALMVEAHRESGRSLRAEARRKDRGAAALRRQKNATIQIEADPQTGRFVQQQVPITPLPLLIAKKDGEREALLEEMIDEMEEDEALELCAELGEELPEETLEMAQIALRMHYTQNKDRGLHVNAAGTVPFTSYRIGDQQLRAYAEGIRRLGDQGIAIRRMELGNNAITDEGLVPLARALQSCRSLEYLDLSENRIRSDGCEALGRLVQAVDPPTQVKSIILAKNNLGDKAGKLLCDALADQLTMTELDLSSNKLGGAAFGEALRGILENNSVLERLELGWNGITSSIAKRIVPGLSTNPSLQYIGLQWNALGDEGGVALGYALRHNKALEVLDVSHCSIAERGAMVLSDMLIENRVITSLVLDDNPVGKRGGRAILRALRSIVLFKMERAISLRNCNFDYQSTEHLFDPSEPGGSYVCHLEDPYERTVGNELVELAWREVGENWEDEQLDGKAFELPEPPEGVVWTREDYRLPETGILSLKYKPTKRVPRMEQVIDEPMFEALCMMMQDKHVTDQGYGLVKLASEECVFITFSPRFHHVFVTFSRAGGSSARVSRGRLRR